MLGSRLALFAGMPLLFATLTGCMMFGGQSRTGIPVSPESAKRLEPGRTSQREVVEELGPPTRQEGRLLVYESSVVDGDTLFFPLFVTAVTESRRLAVLLDDQGRVSEVLDFSAQREVR